MTTERIYTLTLFLRYSYCGSGPAYCGANCQLGFGRCTPGHSSSSTKSSSTLPISPSTARTPGPRTTVSSCVSSTIHSSRVSSSIEQTHSLGSLQSFGASSLSSSTIAESSTPIASTTFFHHKAHHHPWLPPLKQVRYRHPNIVNLARANPLSLWSHRLRLPRWNKLRHPCRRRHH